MARWLDSHPDDDARQLRALIRQARRDVLIQAKAGAGEAVRQGHAHREIYQLVHARLASSEPVAAEASS